MGRLVVVLSAKSHDCNLPSVRTYANGYTEQQPLGLLVCKCNTLYTYGWPTKSPSYEKLSTTSFIRVEHSSCFAVLPSSPSVFLSFSMRRRHLFSMIAYHGTNRSLDASRNSRRTLGTGCSSDAQDRSTSVVVGVVPGPVSAHCAHCCAAKVRMPTLWVPSRASSSVPHRAIS